MWVETPISFKKKKLFLEKAFLAAWRAYVGIAMDKL